VASVGAQSVGSPQTPGAGRNNQIIGQFLVDFGGGDVTLETDPQNGKWIFLLRAGKGQVVKATTARYDIAAPSIDFTYNTKTKLVTTGKAIGGVHVVVRDPDRSQLTTLSGDSADYNGTSDPPRITINGNVRSVLRSPQFDPNNPLVTTAQSGYVEFLDNGRVRVKLSNASAAGTAIEPAPKKKP